MVPLSRLSRKPRVISFDDAAAIATAGCTAYQCVSEVADVKTGQRVLVLGGDTAVGSMFIELAKMAGAWYDFFFCYLFSWIYLNVKYVL